MSKARPTIVLMLRAPLLGKVKTRLAAEVGAEEALSIYRRLVERQAREVPPGWPSEVHFAPADRGRMMREWLGKPEWRYYPQSGADLGERLGAAMAGAFARGAEGALFIGGDCPYLTADLLESAAAALEATDAVIGPAADGGYYLLGMKKPAGELFSGIPWGTENAFSATVKRASEAGLAWAVLPEREDIDDAAAWRRWAGGAGK